MNERTKGIVKKTLDIVSTVLISIVFVIGLIFSLMAFSSGSDGVPRVFGTALLDVKTDSMKGTIEVGDLIFVSKVKDFGSLKSAELDESGKIVKPGDIITFRGFIGVNEDIPGLVTHMIIDKKELSDGSYQFTTRGTGEQVDFSATQQVSQEEVIGVYDFKWNGFGYVVRFISSGVGFFIIIILPLLAFFGYRVFVLIKTISDLKKEKLVEQKDSDIDKLKRELDELRQKLVATDNLATESATNVATDNITSDNLATDNSITQNVATENTTTKSITTDGEDNTAKTITSESDDIKG